MAKGQLSCATLITSVTFNEAEALTSAKNAHKVIDGWILVACTLIDLASDTLTATTLEWRPTEACVLG